MQPLRPITTSDITRLTQPTARLRDTILGGHALDSHERAVENKTASMQALAQRLRGDKDFMSFLTSEHAWLVLDIAIAGATGADPIETAVAAITHQWARQHHDSGANWALLRAASDELGAPMRSDCMPEEGWEPDDQGRYPELEDPQLQAGLRSFVRASHSLTQQALGRLGIDEVLAVRGVRYDSATTGLCPFERGTSAQAPDLNSLSAFSLDMPTALEFAAPLEPDQDAPYVEQSSVIAARIPAERIVSMPVSGLGSTRETELIVMGAPAGHDLASVSTTSWPLGMPERMHMPWQIEHLAVRSPVPSLSRLDRPEAGSLGTGDGSGPSQTR